MSPKAVGNQCATNRGKQQRRKEGNASYAIAFPYLHHSPATFAKLRFVFKKFSHNPFVEYISEKIGKQKNDGHHACCSEQGGDIKGKSYSKEGSKNEFEHAGEVNEEVEA